MIQERYPPPFIIHALGRSRTAWLSKFLSHGPWQCSHEVGLFMRSFSDLETFLNQPYVGTAETGAILAWPLINHVRPDARTVLIRRDVSDATRAMAETYEKAGLPFDAAKLKSIFLRSERALDKMACRPGTLSIAYEDLETENGCRLIYEYCLLRPFERDWWLFIKDQKIEADLREVVGYYWKNRQGIENFKRLCKTELTRLVRSGELRHAVN